MNAIGVLPLPPRMGGAKTGRDESSPAGYNQQTWSVLLAGCSDFGAEYLRRLLDGDTETERHFAHHFGQLIEVKLRFRVRRTQEVEDLRQETLMRVLATIRRDGGLDRPERLGAFVNGVCNNVLLEYYRRDAEAQTSTEETDEPRGTEMPVDERIISNEARGAVRVVVGSLPKKDRELLRRVFLEEEDKDAVCREMSVSRNYLRVLLFRARGKLRKVMAEQVKVRAGDAAHGARIAHGK